MKRVKALRQELGCLCWLMQNLTLPTVGCYLWLRIYFKRSKTPKHQRAKQSVTQQVTLLVEEWTVLHKTLMPCNNEDMAQQLLQTSVKTHHLSSVLKIRLNLKIYLHLYYPGTVQTYLMPSGGCLILSGVFGERKKVKYSLSDLQGCLEVEPLHQSCR